jgi:hypothetical protein
MGRNKLSACDRIKHIQDIEKLINDISEAQGDGKFIRILKLIKSIRSKTLKRLCLFHFARLDNFTLFTEFSPRELSKLLNVGERTIYDYIKVERILGAISDNSFSNLFTNNPPLKKQLKNTKI